MRPETPPKVATGTAGTERVMDTQHAIDAQAKNLALRQLSTVAKGELDVVVDKMTEGARLAGPSRRSGMR